MLKIQTNIEILKQETARNMEQLKNEELALTKEVTIYEDIVNEWERPLDIKDCALLVPKRISTSANNLSQVNMKHNFISLQIKLFILQEAKDFLFFVAKSGGHENGWSVEDHRSFLKVRNSTKNVEQLAQILHKKLPGKSIGVLILLFNNFFK